MAYLIKTNLITWQGHSWIKELLSGSWLLRKTPFFIFPITVPGKQIIDEIMSILHVRVSHPLSSPHPCSCRGGACPPCAWTINYFVNDCRSGLFYCQNSSHTKKCHWLPPLCDYHLSSLQYTSRHVIPQPLGFFGWLWQELWGFCKSWLSSDLNTAASLWTTGSSSSPSFKRNKKSPTYLLWIDCQIMDSTYPKL